MTHPNDHDDITIFFTLLLSFAITWETASDRSQNDYDVLETQVKSQYPKFLGVFYLDFEFSEFLARLLIMWCLQHIIYRRFNWLEMAKSLCDTRVCYETSLSDIL